MHRRVRDFSLALEMTAESRRKGEGGAALVTERSRSGRPSLPTTHMTERHFDRREKSLFAHNQRFKCRRVHGHLRRLSFLLTVAMYSEQHGGTSVNSLHFCRGKGYSQCDSLHLFNIVVFQFPIISLFSHHENHVRLHPHQQVQINGLLWCYE